MDNCAQVGNNNSCTIQQQANAISRNVADAQQLKALVAQDSQSQPEPPGPWSYLVYNTANAVGVDVGLKVKTAPSLDGLQVGSVASRALVWADCYVLNSFNPERGSDVDVGPKWLRIRWPTNSAGTTFASSSPTDTFTQYVYAEYTLSFTHNGEIPACA